MSPTFVAATPVSHWLSLCFCDRSDKQIQGCAGNPQAMTLLSHDPAAFAARSSSQIEHTVAFSAWILLTDQLHPIEHHNHWTANQVGSSLAYKFY